jgi:hypothetical protein
MARGDARLERIRETILSGRETRASAQSVVEAMLEEIADLDDDDVAPAWAENAAEAAIPGYELGEMTAGELRERLRSTLAEIAARDA